MRIRVKVGDMEVEIEEGGVSTALAIANSIGEAIKENDRLGVSGRAIGEVLAAAKKSAREL